MDYKYIEQLLERYWQCETSLEEEEMLRLFFRQEEIPGKLLPYRDLFRYESEAGKTGLGPDFDRRITALTEKTEAVKARRLPIRSRLRPLWSSAAVIAMLLIAGHAIQQVLRADKSDYNYENYRDTYTDPHAAYGEVSDALMAVSARLNKYQEQITRDSLKMAGAARQEATAAGRNEEGQQP